MAADNRPQPAIGAISADAVIDEVTRLATELYPGRAGALQVTLDSGLDRELGLDSLSRVELLVRLQRTFGVALPDAVVADAETPRDLWQALLASGSGGHRVGPAATASRPAERAQGTPDAAGTLLEVLDWHARLQGERPQVHLYGDGDEPEPISYAALTAGARRLAAGLQANGLMPGEAVAIMLPTGRDYLFSFFGTLMAGGIPVPIYPPMRASQLEDHLDRHAGILANAASVLLLTVPEARGVARLLQTRVESLRGVLVAQELGGSDAPFTRPVVRPGDTAFLQYTSGSTGQPKGVILSHANLLSNIRAMGTAARVDGNDVFVSWLPLYHDMGLIGAWLGSLYYGVQLVLMSPLAFLTRPARWLWAIHRHRGTLTAAPNFAYELCLHRLDDTELEGLDLGSLRLAFNGAEPVRPATLRRFAARFAVHGLAREALAPVYGLAEAAVGLAFPPPGRGPRIDVIRRGPFTAAGRAEAAADAETDPLEFVACGRPLPGYQVRVTDAAGHELPDRREGHLEFLGPSATAGYLRNPGATTQLFNGAWLRTGDLAYIADGDIYPTGRVKDVIIRAGRNIYPQELEERVGELPGIRRGCVAVFGSPDPNAGTERLVVVAETRETETSALERLRAAVRAAGTELLGLPPEEVVLAPPHTVLKTSSGKIRHAAVRELFEQGRIGRAPRAAWRQIAALALSSLKPALRGAWRQSIDLSYAGYAHALFWLLAPPTWLTIALLPGRRLRWAVMRGGARLLFRLAGVAPRVSGLASWPAEGACVIVANHASYLDGVVLAAVLPPGFAFVAKRELGERFVSRVFLQRVGTVFVERFDQRRGISDARHLVGLARSGRSLLFFPEGTFTRIPGLRPFHMGAFVAAAEAGAPVVPVTIRGTRSILRGDTRFPHRAPLTVRIGDPIRPGGSGWKAALELRDASRAALLADLGEPDLAEQDSAINSPDD